ncbi:plasmid IncI1-type surface exclusion protein ExcA [Lelliottia wanjuensis]|uniref:plasmid IncI1-type surface exclusion protein ExcA n=1 Tax=Lelliottia wanjuensis TaxID=3050585 RepID=UPI002549F76D|nr:plasmid IncI1-type surface exclusion protein ExcA [Lelliottia sp. V104_15]MDK9605889.1 plasmid IncI1-type surface exclusion protein ExcA [Lelliottia sp. V104_15]
MKAVQRTDSRLDKLWLLVRFAYYFLALPYLVFMGISMAFVSYGTAVGKTTGADSQFYSVAIVVWLLAIVPLAIRRYGKVSRRRQLKKMAAMLSSPERFSPQKQHQVLDAGRGKYLGVDTERGTILYIHIVKKGLIDVVGLTMQGWTNRELEGTALRLYTRMPDVPVLSVYAHQTVARELFNTLGAMSHNSYSEPFPKEPWPEYVGRQSRFVEFEHNVVVPQVV